MLLLEANLVYGHGRSRPANAASERRHNGVVERMARELDRKQETLG